MAQSGYRATYRGRNPWLARLEGTLKFGRRPKLIIDRWQQAEGKTMQITRTGSRSITKGSADYFNGSVNVEPLVQATPPATIRAASVTFEPGARTAWHTHPLGQTLIITSGFGWAQCVDGPLEELRPGDVVWFAPGEKHWHGATPKSAMTHIAIQEALNGEVVRWMEQVSDAQYGAGS